MEQQKNHRPKITAFVCNWCSYAGADAAGTSRLQYDDSVRIIRLPCTGRADPLFIVKAFEQGADAVLVSGCHPGDCHYVSGNLYARRRFTIFKKLMDFLGLDERRLQFSWVSAAEGVKWAQVVNAVSDGVKEIVKEDFVWAKARDGKAGATKNKETSPPKPTVREEDSAKEAAQTEELRDLARQLLTSKKVGVIVGYAQGSLPNTMTPFFATRVEQVDHFVWNQHCLNNLTVYLTKQLVRKLGPVGIVVKGCDAKAIIGLLQENQIKREDVFIIGMACDGMTQNGAIAAKCETCRVRTPGIYDKLIGQPSSSALGKLDPIEEEIRQVDAMSLEERWDYWQHQFARCIRCYACRAVCPLCYCETCIADKHRPQWILPEANPKGNLSWNIFRAMHLAGRCIGCNECARVCPAGIRLDLINRKLALEIKRAFDYEAGVDSTLSPALTTYRPDDSEEFIR